VTRGRLKTVTNFEEFYDVKGGEEYYKNNANDLLGKIWDKKKTPHKLQFSTDFSANTAPDDDNMRVRYYDNIFWTTNWTFS